MATSSAVAIRPKPRLQKPAYLQVNDDTWDLLTTSTFPTAQDPNSIALVYSLCQHRRLDIFRKPYHIVSMWNSLAGRLVEQVIPGINELLVTAVRTGEFCGVDPPVYGPEITETFHGRRKIKEQWTDVETTITYPETISITVWRLVRGQRCAFSMPVRWREEYQRVGGSALPNEMWQRRTYDQCQKVALAASLRVAFSDVVEPEPEDLSVAPRPGEAEVIEHEQPPARPQPPSKGLPEAEPPKTEPPMDPVTGEISPHTIEFVDVEGEQETWQQWGARMIAAVESAETEADVEQWVALNQGKLDTFKTDAPTMLTRMEARINKQRNKIRTAQAKEGDGK